jgi:drug/metabolite transporter (DMT)-like permease
MGIALAGTVITCAGDLQRGGGALGGDFLALAGAACLAGYLLIGRRLLSSLGVALYSCTVYGIVALVAVLTTAAEASLHAPSPRSALFGAALAVVCTLGGHTVYNLALRYVPALTVSVAFLGEAPLTSLLALIILGTAPQPATILGGVAILAGVGFVLFPPPAPPRVPAIALE